MKNLDMPFAFESERLRFRKHNLELASEMFIVVDKNRERLSRHMPWAAQTKELKDTENYITQNLQQWDKSEVFDFGIFLKTNSKFIGNIGLHSLSLKDERVEMGYWLDQHAERKGYMTEAVAQLEEICFKLGFNRLEIRCSDLNPRSAAVPKRRGFKLERILKNNRKLSAGFENTMVFAKLRKP